MDADRDASTTGNGGADRFGLLSGASHSAGDAFLASLEATCHRYDENLFYACREYMLIHELNSKKHQRDRARALIQKTGTHVHLTTRAWLLLRYDHPFASKAGICYFAVQTMLAVASVASLSFESSPEYNGEVFPPYRQFWPLVDVPVAVLLTLDLVIYYVLLPTTPNEYSGGVSKKNFFFQLRVWIDLTSTVPTFLTFLEEFWEPFGRLSALKVLRVLRFVRALRVLHSVDMLLHTLERSVAPLLAPLALFVGMVIFFSTAIYYAEKGDYDAPTGLFLTPDCDCEMSAQRVLFPGYPCPPRASAFISIPHTMWYVVVTLTTVGYGDVIPACALGKFLATACMFLGGVVIAMPIAIVGMYYTTNVLADRAGKRSDPLHAFGRKPSGSGAGGDALASTSPAAAADAAQALLRRRKDEREAKRKRRRNDRSLFGTGLGDGDDENPGDTGEPCSDASLALQDGGDGGGSCWGGRHTPGLHVLDTIAEALDNPTMPLQSVSLVAPESAVVRDVNLRIQQLFRAFLESHLSSGAAIETLRRRVLLLATAKIGLSLVSFPEKSLCDPSLHLSRAVPFVFASGDGVARGASFEVASRMARRHAAGSAAASSSDARGGLTAPLLSRCAVCSVCTAATTVPEVGICPNVWLMGAIDPLTSRVAIAPATHQRVLVNEAPLVMGTWRALCVGDVVSVFHKVGQSVGRGSGGCAMGEVAVQYELLRVDGGSGMPQADLLPQDLELRVLPLQARSTDRRDTNASPSVAAGSPLEEPPTRIGSEDDGADEGFLLVEAIRDDALNGEGRGGAVPGRHQLPPVGMLSPQWGPSSLTFADYQQGGGLENRHDTAYSDL